MLHNIRCRFTDYTGPFMAKIILFSGRGAKCFEVFALEKCVYIRRAAKDFDEYPDVNEFVCFKQCSI